MPEPISLISSAEIETAGFLTFLEYCDVLLHPDNVYDGRISRANTHLSIVLDNTELKNFSTDEIELITQKFTAKPQTHILLDVSKTPGSEQLALEFACKFAKKWSCVMAVPIHMRYNVISQGVGARQCRALTGVPHVNENRYIYDSSQKVYSAEELLGLCQTESGFV